MLFWFEAVRAKLVLDLMGLGGRPIIPGIRKFVSPIRRKLFPNREVSAWRADKFPMPAPAIVKWGVLHRWGIPNGTWVETGTYQGHTTAFLASTANHVYSIEPDTGMARRARQRFLHTGNVTIINGLSENFIGKILDQVSGPLSLWLDGHFSGPGTHRGPSDTPIVQELKAVQSRLHKFKEISVLVDDVRLFDPTNPAFASYPNRSWLVGWADESDLEWHIEHDIFIARKRFSPLKGSEVSS